MPRKPQSPASSWRKIQQGNKRTKTTKVARQRSLNIFFRTGLVILLFIMIATGIVAIYYLSDMGREPVTVTRESSIDVMFESDGVLSGKWFQRYFPDIMAAEVRQIDVGALKEQLEAHGQIVAATVTLSLPSNLMITLQERKPILRMRVRNADGSPSTLLIARDGVIYQGADYPVETLRNLPGVAGLRVRTTGQGYEPVKGLEAVAFLLQTAQKKLPAVYRHWQVVDLSDWNAEVNYRPSLVRVKSSHIEEIIFSTYAIEEQMDRLGGILQHIQRYQLGQPKLIDLSFGEEAVIRYK
jgi:cell division septal protein FtsQ